MTITQPDSMDDCVYFTRRTVGDKGKIMAWARKIDCEKCGKAKMGKPVEKGKIKIRAKEYECPSCKHVESKEEHEPKLTVEVLYTCPDCGKAGEATTPYKRKTFEGVPSFVFECGSCGKKIGITKKMKAPKKSKKAVVDIPDDDE